MKNGAVGSNLRHIKEDSFSNSDDLYGIMLFHVLIHHSLPDISSKTPLFLRR